MFLLIEVNDNLIYVYVMSYLRPKEHTSYYCLSGINPYRFAGVATVRIIVIL